MSRSIIHVSAIVSIAALNGCTVSPRSPDRELLVHGVDSRLVNAPEVRLEILPVNGATIPEAALDRALDRIRPVLAGSLEVVELEGHTLPADDSGCLLHRFEWPLLDASGRRITADEVGAAGGRLQVVGPDGKTREATVTELEDGGGRVDVQVGPETVLLAVVPREPGVEASAYCRHMPTVEADGTFHFEGGGALLVLQAEAIEGRGGIFVRDETLWEWTLVHEFGHALGLPGDPDRAWRGPRAGAHCTRPECVMYPAVDWRSVLSLLFNGWPLDYCASCLADLEAVRGGRH